MEKEQIAEILINQIRLLEKRQEEIHDSLFGDRLNLEIALSNQILEIAKELNELRKIGAR